MLQVVFKKKEKPKTDAMDIDQSGRRDWRKLLSALTV
jgi:hypothetical protein